MKERYDDLDEYIADLKKEIEANEQCATHYYNLGLALLTKRDFVAAEEALLNAVRNSPHLAEAYVQLGGICLERGDLEGCLRYNEEAANCRAKFPIPWSNIAFVHLQRGEPDKAITALRKALKWDPKFVQAKNALSTAYYMKGDFKACEETCAAIEEVTTPDQHTIEEVCGFLKVPAQKLIKTLLYVVDGKPVAALVRGDRELNEIKLKNYFKADEVVLASPEQVTQWTNAPVGFAGPVGFTAGPIVADHELMADTDWIAGANKADTHILHVDLKRDVPAFAYADLRSIAEGDVCPRCGKPVAFAKGIEVGHVFKLGTKYSTALNAIYLDENGKEQTIIMGCYGIGVSRVVAACIEQNNDGDGIAFPPPLAPFDLELLNLDPKNADTAAKADELYDLLTGMGLDVLLDDREERPGVKFKDADLVGLPMQVVVGGKGLARGIVEVKNRKTGEKGELPVEGFAEAFAAWRKGVLACWGM